MRLNQRIIFYILGFLTACSKPQSDIQEADNTKPQNALASADTEILQEPDAAREAEKIGMQALVDAYIKRTGQKIKFLKKDLANGYMEFEYEEHPVKITYPCQFAYFVTDSQREILALTVPQCMMSCGTSLFFYEMMDNQLMEVQDMIEGAVDMNQAIGIMNEVYESTMTTEQKDLEKQGAMGIYDQIISLPQFGTSIQLNNVFRGKSRTVAELRFNIKTGKFALVKLN